MEIFTDTMSFKIICVGMYKISNNLGNEAGRGKCDNHISILKGQGFCAGIDNTINALYPNGQPDIEFTSY